MTKKAAALLRKIEWNTAIAESRAVRYEPNGMQSFLTTDAACSFIRALSLNGLRADIIDPALALSEYVKDGVKITTTYQRPTRLNAR